MNNIIKISTLLMLSTLIRANTLHVDNVNNCAGLTNCFTTIQQAVNNAETDDEIRVFPGIYPESVDLSQMGSALGAANNGNIRFVTVDLNNGILARTVQVSPVTGIAFTHSGSFFNGNITIDGFVVKSSDDDGVDLDLVGGDITIRNMTASDNDSDGIDIQVATGGFAMRVSNTITNNNGSHGLNLDGADQAKVFIQNAQANNNIGEGISIQSEDFRDVLEVTIIDSSILNNGDDDSDSAGVEADFEGSLTVKNIISNSNHGPGIAIIDVTQTVVTDSIFENNAITEGYSGIFLVSAGTFSVDRSLFNGNGDSGINVYGTNIKGNELTEFKVACSSFSGNEVGVYFNNSPSENANYNINLNNFSNHSIAAIHAGFNNDSIDASNNWWGEASGPTHLNNPKGMGDNVSDILDDEIGGALGTISYTPFLTNPVILKQQASDSLFVSDFEGNICTQL